MAVPYSTMAEKKRNRIFNILARKAFNRNNNLKKNVTIKPKKKKRRLCLSCHFHSHQCEKQTVNQCESCFFCFKFHVNQHVMSEKEEYYYYFIPLCGLLYFLCGQKFGSFLCSFLFSIFSPPDFCKINTYHTLILFT